jgi:bacterioferritin
MTNSNSTRAQQIAQAASAFEQQLTGRVPKSVTVVLSGDTLVITLHGALSEAEKAVAKSPAGAAEVQEFYRQLFANSFDSLRQEIKRIAGVEVREAASEIEPTTGTVVKAFSTGTVVQVFLLAHSVPTESWNGNELGGTTCPTPTIAEGGSSHAQHMAMSDYTGFSGDMNANQEEVITMTMPVRTQKDDQPKAEVARGDKPTATTTNRQALIKGLNHDLAGEYQAILMYTHYSAKLTGPYRRELRALFQAEIGDEQGHAQFLADKVAALGGEPTTEPRSVPPANQPREMLEHALAAEKQAIADYNGRIHQAEAFGDLGLKADLESQVADETGHKEELERIIAGWDQR